MMHLRVFWASERACCDTVIFVIENDTLLCGMDAVGLHGGNVQDSRPACFGYCCVYLGIVIGIYECI
jgi:hypothetical protein